MAVDPTKPANMYKGSDFQEHQRARRELLSGPPPSPPSGTVTPPPLPITTIYSPVRGDVLPAPTYGGSNGGGASGVTGAGVGIAGVLGEKSGDLANSVVEHVWPLKACIRLGECMVNAEPRVKLWTAVPCALIGVGIAAGMGWSGPALIVAVVLGGALGWFLPAILGTVLAFGAFVTGLVIGLSFLALVIVAILLVVRAVTS